MMKVKKSHHDSLSPGGLNVIEAAVQVTQVARPISQSLLQRHPQLTNFLERKILKPFYSKANIFIWNKNPARSTYQPSV